MQIHALWCHPRSVSTAFERIMRERGDLDVLHEPFMYHYYLTQTDRLFADFHPEPGHPKTYGDIRRMIMTRSQAMPVFFKDMAYYIDDELPRDTTFLSSMTHAFLVRDPAESILSYHKREPGFTCRELGLEAQLRLYRALEEEGQAPIVVTADQLRNDPEATLRRYWSTVGLPYVADAFSWDESVPKDWQSVSDWHATALSSGRIQQSRTSENSRVALEHLGEPFTTYDRHHRPAYEVLSGIAERQAHQK
ncbi:MAG: hypothetical protein AAGF79_20060 [Pseudomonadota bacterium]